MNQQHPIAKLGLLVLIAVGITAGLHHLDAGLRISWSDPIGWFETASAEDAIGAALRMVGLAVGYWVTISTGLYIMASSRRRRPKLVTWATLPAIRGMVDRTLATALAASIAASPLSPALAEQAPPPPVIFDINSEGVPVPHIRAIQPAEDVLLVSVEPQAATPDELSRPPVALAVAPARASTVAASSDTYTVNPGDSLWAIAVRQVEQEIGDDQSVATVTSYWRDVVDANRATLRSGDPNLIYPGEIVILPEVAR
jgi:hypothetical protein